MTFTRGQPRHFITHFYKVAELVWQTGTTHKQQRKNNTSNLLGKSNKSSKGEEVFQVTFYVVKTRDVNDQSLID